MTTSHIIILSLVTLLLTGCWFPRNGECIQVADGDGQSYTGKVLDNSGNGYLVKLDDGRLIDTKDFALFTRCDP